MAFDYTLDYKNLDLRKHPELYRVGKGEQGVLLVEPYKSEILPHWRFRTPDIAEKSSKEIYNLFLRYKKKNDFVGMDMARKFLQMGYTRSRRYANHSSGKKYSDEDKNDAVVPKNIPDYRSEKNRKHHVKTKTKKVLPQEKDALTNEKAESAKIFYKMYEKAKNDSVYMQLKTEHKEKYS
jgi:hypothetical protein